MTVLVLVDFHQGISLGLIVAALQEFKDFVPVGVVVPPITHLVKGVSKVQSREIVAAFFVQCFCKCLNLFLVYLVRLCWLITRRLCSCVRWLLRESWPLGSDRGCVFPGLNRRLCRSLGSGERCVFL